MYFVSQNNSNQHMYYLLLSFRIFLNLPDGYFYLKDPRLSGWIHVTLNYLGPNIGEGIKIFYDGTEVVSDTTKDGGSFPAGDGRIVLGRFFTDTDEKYTSMQVDELLLFNEALSATDIALLCNRV